MNTPRIPPVARDNMSVEALGALGPLADRSEIDKRVRYVGPTPRPVSSVHATRQPHPVQVHDWCPRT